MDNPFWTAEFGPLLRDARAFWGSNVIPLLVVNGRIRVLPFRRESENSSGNLACNA